MQLRRFWKSIWTGSRKWSTTAGWMRKSSQGRTFGEKRDNQNLKHPLMIPYGDLPANEKDKDRVAIRGYPNLLAEAGYKIVFKRRPQD
jgi:hypothetical protein